METTKPMVQEYWIEQERLGDIITDLLKLGYNAALVHDSSSVAFYKSYENSLRESPAIIEHGGLIRPYRLIIQGKSGDAEQIYKAARAYFDSANHFDPIK